jgi:hypothetical protein
MRAQRSDGGLKKNIGREGGGREKGEGRGREKGEGRGREKGDGRGREARWGEKGCIELKERR